MTHHRLSLAFVLASFLMASGCVVKESPSDEVPDAAGGSDAGAGGTPAEGCSCGAAGVSSSGALSSGAGLLLAFGAMLRVRRRRSTRPPR